MSQSQDDLLVVQLPKSSNLIAINIRKETGVFQEATNEFECASALR